MITMGKSGACNLFSGIIALLQFSACPVNCSKDRPPGPPAGAFASNGDGHIGNSFQPASIALNFTAPLHLVFLGDSTFRYEYLGLIYYLEKGKLYVPSMIKQGRLSCRDMTNSHTCSCPPTPNKKRNSAKCDKHQIAFETISPHFAGRELCDCYRGGGPSGKEHYLNRATENRCGPLPCSALLPAPLFTLHAFHATIAVLSSAKQCGEAALGGGVYTTGTPDLVIRNTTSITSSLIVPSALVALITNATAVSWLPSC